MSNRARAAAVAALVMACGAVPPPDREARATILPSVAATPSPSSTRSVQPYFSFISFPNRSGQPARVEVTALPGSICSATYVWPGMPSPAPSFPVVSADRRGIAAWTWTMDPRMPSGSWLFTATCDGFSASTHVPVN